MRGNILFRKNKYSEALADFTEVLNTDPINVECLYNRGVYVRTIPLYFMSFDITE
jgi:tetratricopeptide (TPR) repeat protein